MTDHPTTADTFAATYVTFRHVQGRKTVQFVFEVPVEQFKAASDILGGAPNIDQSVWVAIARMAPGAPQTPAGKQVAEKPRRHREDMPVGSQAALACKDVAFQKWWALDDGEGIATEQSTADMMREHFGVKSRADIPRDSWDRMYATFEQWAGRVTVPR